MFHLKEIKYLLLWYKTLEEPQIPKIDVDLKTEIWVKSLRKGWDNDPKCQFFWWWWMINLGFSRRRKIFIILMKLTVVTVAILITSLLFLSSFKLKELVLELGISWLYDFECLLLCVWISHDFVCVVHRLPKKKEEILCEVDSQLGWNMYKMVYHDRWIVC